MTERLSAASSLARLFDVSGRRAVVVGAGSGIGRSAAIALAECGAVVFALDRNLPAAGETADLAGPNCTPYCLDILDADAVRAAAVDLPEVDVLVITAATNIRKRILEYSAEEFSSVTDLNLRGSFVVLQAFGRGMVDRGRGSIIGFTSVRATSTEPGQAVYSATKAGLVQMLRTAAAEWGPAGVRVNLIAPGVVETLLTEQIKLTPEWYDAYSAKTAIGRWARPEEMTGAVIYLASDASSYVTGSVLFIDGGWTAADGRYTPPS